MICLTRVLQVALVGMGLSLGLVAGAQGPGDRVVVGADYRVKTQLTGHVPAWANAANDAGEALATGAVRLNVVLSLAPEVQARMDQLVVDQQTVGSPRYHHWLTPAEVGAQFGASVGDVATVVGWLRSQGFQVESVAASRRFITVTAPASVAGRALGTSFRMFAVGGVLRRAAVTEPTLPAALAGVVSGIEGLSESVDRPMHVRQTMEGQAGTGRAVGAQGGQDGPQLTTSGGSHFLVPGDFSVIYDLPAGYDGTGQRVAIIGRSQVSAADVNAFQSMVGQAAKVPNVVIPTGAVDPGMPGTADQGEATLDVERVLGQAPGVTADLVVATNASGGIQAAMAYNVNTLLDPVMTVSFGACEAQQTASNVSYYTTLFAQAATEGISVFISAGDSGAAACDTHGQAPPATVQMLSTNYLCASGNVTCVGGTEFNDAVGSYWNTTNTSGKVSATGYIPEGAWNEPTTTSSAGVTTFQIAAGGGGVSTYVSKPTFQTGVGVPADGFRDVPDVSFSASGHDGYFGCYATGGGSCVVDPVTMSFHFESFSGTSAAAPGMAAVAAILNQKLGGRQGNLNPAIYGLAATPANGVFHDATVLTSGVTGCSAGTPSMCNNSTPGATTLTGGLAGYVLGTGYDQATGWGSLDVGRFAAALTAVTPVNTAGISLAAAPGTLLLAAGATSGNASTVTLTPLGGFTGMVALGCTVTFTGTGTVTFAPTCSVAPGSLLTSGTAVVTVSTTVPHATGVVYSSGLDSGSRLGLGALLACGLVGVFGWPVTGGRRRRWRFEVLGMVLLAGVLGLGGCGGGGSAMTSAPAPAPVVPVGTTTGSYRVVVTGTGAVGSGTVTASATIGLTVQ